MSEKITEPASQIADDLYQVIVEEGESGEFDQPEKYGVPETFHASFRAKMRLYREALVLFALISKSSVDESYEPVLRNYEALIMPGSPTIDRATKLEALEGAVHNLKDVLNPHTLEERGLSWSRSWFAGIGLDKYNVVDLCLFSLHWPRTYIVVRKSVHKLIPS